MHQTVSSSYFFMMLPEIQDYIITRILVWNMLVQSVVVLSLFLLARGVAFPLRPWLTLRLDRHPSLKHALGHLGRVIIARLITPMLAIVLLWFAHRTAITYGWPHNGLRIALSLTLAWVIIRLLTAQMKNRTLAKVISVAIWTIAALDIVHLLRPFLALLDSIDFVIGEVRLSVLTVIDGGLILLLLFWLSKRTLMFFQHWIRTVEHVTPSVQVLLYKLLATAMFTLAIIVVFAYMGFSITALAVFSGAIGLGIGVGLQKIFANLISGLIILADKSIKPGDVIQMGDSFGWINYLGGRYISVVTRDGTEHLIPNENLITGEVVNWSYSNNLLRLKMPIGVGYNSDLKLAMALMLEAATATPRVLAQPAPVCRLVEFGDNSVNFSLRVWIQDPQNGIMNVKSQILLGIWERFQEHGITLPFPQRVLHHKPLPELKVALQNSSAGVDA
jgi:small-conductance mechanosensitive channel